MVLGESSAASVTEEKVAQIVAMGYDRESALAELRRFGGDVTKAAAALVAKSIRLPKK